MPDYYLKSTGQKSKYKIQVFLSIGTKTYYSNDYRKIYNLFKKKYFSRIYRKLFVLVKNKYVLRDTNYE